MTFTGIHSVCKMQISQGTLPCKPIGQAPGCPPRPEHAMREKIAREGACMRRGLCAIFHNLKSHAQGDFRLLIVIEKAARTRYI
jgi:hypothetical protein